MNELLLKFARKPCPMKKIPFSLCAGQYSWLVGVNLQSLVGQIAPVGNEMLGLLVHINLKYLV